MNQHHGGDPAPEGEGEGALIEGAGATGAAGAAPWLLGLTRVLPDGVHRVCRGPRQHLAVPVQRVQVRRGGVPHPVHHHAAALRDTAAVYGAGGRAVHQEGANR